MNNVNKLKMKEKNVCDDDEEIDLRFTWIFIMA